MSQEHSFEKLEDTLRKYSFFFFHLSRLKLAVIIAYCIIDEQINILLQLAIITFVIPHVKFFYYSSDAPGD